MSTEQRNKVTQAARVHSLITGTELHSPSGPLTLGGVSFTTQTLIRELTTLANAFSAVDTEKASWKGALKNLADAQAKVGPTLGAYRSWVQATYGNAPAILADFGLAPPKARAPLTTEQQAAAVAKRKATKAARHTMGAVQKKAVKGNVL
jgi:hypothetical protein